MKKLSEYKNEEALDLLAEIIDPVANIFADTEFVDSLQKNKLLAIKYVLKNHQEKILEILAALEGVSVEEYECNIFTLPITLMQLLNDKELLDFFKSQGLRIGEESSGSAMENTEGEQLEDS